MESHELGSELIGRRLLMQLPEFEPDSGLWSRIEFAHQRRCLTQRKRRLTWAGAGLAAACAVVALLPIFSQPSGDSLAAWQERSQELERQWQSQVSSGLQSRVHPQLRMIDADLQAAYDRNADSNELLQLWKLRSSVLSEMLVNPQDTTPLVTRI
jgi:hypothetical protein